MIGSKEAMRYTQDDALLFNVSVEWVQKYITSLALMV